MKNISVSYGLKEISSQISVERDLMWYDNIKKEMQHFKGGQLVFEYKYDNYLEKLGYKNTYRTLPKVIELKEVSKKKMSNKNEIINWFKSYVNYNDSGVVIEDVHEEGVSFNVPDNEVDDFSFGLDRSNFDYREA